MPALVKRSVGSLRGTSGEDGTISCPRPRKNSTKLARISESVFMQVVVAGGLKLVMARESGRYPATACHVPPRTANCFAKDGGWVPSEGPEVAKERLFRAAPSGVVPDMPVRGNNKLVGPACGAAGFTSLRCRSPSRIRIAQ